MTARLVAVAAVAVIASLVGGCGGSGNPEASTSTLPPNVVPERASAWTSIVVRAADGRRADVPTGEFGDAAPLLTGRLLASPEALASYGLDAPVATLEYRGPGRARTVRVGAPNFDGHGYYVQRDGDRRVFVVPADQLGPLLRLVGLQPVAPR